MKRGEELKAPRYASAAATRDRNLRQSAGYLWQIAGTITSLKYPRVSLPTLATLLLWLPFAYKYRLTSVMNINPPHSLLPLQYKSRCPKICLLAYSAFLPV